MFIKRLWIFTECNYVVGEKRAAQYSGHFEGYMQGFYNIYKRFSYKYNNKSGVWTITLLQCKLCDRKTSDETIPKKSLKFTKVMASSSRWCPKPAGPTAHGNDLSQIGQFESNFCAYRKELWHVSKLAVLFIQIVLTLKPFFTIIFVWVKLSRVGRPLFWQIQHILRVR